MQSFWSQLPKPFFAMAPMADVTDSAWRALVAELGKPDVTFTEFVSADGLYHTCEPKWGFTKPPYQDGENPLMRDLQYTEAERPIVMQVFTGKPEIAAYAARFAQELGFDGLDINMGCPDRTIEHQGAGAALIKTPELATALIHAAQEVVKEIPNLSYRPDLVFPISVKTRIGFNTEALDEWLPALLEAGPAAITLHLRTRKEMSLVPAQWETMAHAVELRNRIAPEVLLIGNGDVKDLEDAQLKAVDTGCDGVMIGRGMFGNPWIFEGLRKSFIGAGLTKSEHGLEEKLATLLELAYRFEALTPPKHFAILKKHIKAFVTGFDGASELRVRLMEAENASELERIIKENPL